MDYDFVDEIPVEVQQAMWKIKNSIQGADVRDGIVTALTWGMEHAFVMGQYINSLGLTVEDHKLCYTTKDVVETYDDIPDEISLALQEIIADVYGRETRAAIVKALKWASDYVSSVAGHIHDLGLTVVDGKLCAIFGRAPLTPEMERLKSIYASPGTDVDDEGYVYLGDN